MIQLKGSITKPMKLPTILAISLATIGITTLSQAEPSTYQVTGPVLEVTESKLVIQKGKEQWEIARNSATQVTGDLKVGSKVTIQYTMAAATIAVKVEKEKKEKKPVATKPAAKPNVEAPANAEKAAKPAPEVKAPKPAKAAKPAEKPAAPVKKAA
jgi:RNase P/RNase MRP subunit p29